MNQIVIAIAVYKKLRFVTLTEVVPTSFAIVKKFRISFRHLSIPNQLSSFLLAGTTDGLDTKLVDGKIYTGWKDFSEGLNNHQAGKVKFTRSRCQAERLAPARVTNATDS
jgi:hypothetical protein